MNKTQFCKVFMLTKYLIFPENCNHKSTNFLSFLNNGMNQIQKAFPLLLLFLLALSTFKFFTLCENSLYLTT